MEPIARGQYAHGITFTSNGFAAAIQLVRGTPLIPDPNDLKETGKFILKPKKSRQSPAHT
jgi:hypothetical protein